MPANYTTEAQTRADVLTEVQDDDDAGIARIEVLISAASRLVDRYTDRPENYFGPAATDPTVRRYRGNGSNFLQIGRHVAGSVTIQNVETSLFYEHESNGWIYSVEPAATIGENADYAPGGVGSGIMFAKGGLYHVSARWGFLATPTDIAYAVELIVQHIWEKGKGVIGQISPTGFVIERDIPPTARLILDNWKRRPFEAN